MSAEKFERDYEVVQYLCPNCKKHLNETHLLMHPPIKRFECVNPECGYTATFHPKIVKKVLEPFSYCHYFLEKHIE